MPLSSADFYRKAPPDRGASSFVYPPTEANLRFFVDALAAGCLVAIPTETVYGLAGLALDEAASRSIFTIKGRPLVDPLIVHVKNPLAVARLAEVPPSFHALAGAFWPGPLTVILPKKPTVPDLVTAGKQTVAVRMPRHPVARAILDALEAPLAAPSANPFGYVSPTTAGHVAESFGDKVPFIIDGGPCDIGLESTIIDLSDPSQPQVLRPGAISAQAIEEVLKVPVVTRDLNLHQQETATAPGTFSRHYSPNTPLDLFEAGSIPGTSEGEALVLLQRGHTPTGKDTYWLSEDGMPGTVARSLFTLLRQLDKQGYTRIHWELPAAETSPLHLAIRDRMERAASRK